ncbi:hypothetical protein HYZ97_03525 [Candidatus Pacearchaeota archaeon]|nr:hypothetical protein [Candidatus Pacearchaeota archaeon]
MKGGIMAKGKGNLIGSWSFLIGVILAIILGLFGSVTGNILIILVVIGLIVGLLNIADKEAGPFLLSGAVLIIASAFGGDVLQAITLVDNILNALLAIFVPATIIVAIRNVFGLARR